MPADSNAERLAKEATFVFKGTVRALKKSTMPDLPVNARTAIVSVDDIVQAPAAFANFAGQEITVQIGGRKKIAPGYQVMFYANSWRFGEGIAVRAIDFLPAEEVPSRLRAAGLAAVAPHGLAPARSSAAETLADRELQRQVEAADVVVTGRVTAVRAPSEPSSAPGARRMMRAGGPTTAPQPQRISEHDPLWQEAVVEVTGTEKGGPAKQIVVRFPSSRDVRWYKAPKFTPGQEGVFILRKSTKDAVPGAAKALAAGRARVGPEVYSVEHSADFQPMHRAESIKTLLKPSENVAAPAATPKVAAGGRRPR
jgi:hypothetical protein